MVLQIQQIAHKIRARHENACHEIDCEKRFIIGNEIILCWVQAYDTQTKAKHEPQVYSFCSQSCYTKFDKLVEEKMKADMGNHLIAIIEGGNRGDFES